jgi:death-on-curing protein
MITPEEILEIHKTTIEMDRNNPDDYAPGVRNIGTIELMIEYKMDPTESVYFNASVALHTIASEHPFNNGNKRTVTATALMILKNEGINLTINEESKINFIIDIATPEKNISIEMVEEWLKKNTKRTNEL